jgi:hypothetical protein
MASRMSLPPTLVEHHHPFSTIVRPVALAHFTAVSLKQAQLGHFEEGSDMGWVYELMNVIETLTNFARGSHKVEEHSAPIDRADPHPLGHRFAGCDVL